MLLPRYGGNNQAGDLAPRTGAQSNAIKANMRSLFVQPQTVQGKRGFNNYVGATEIPGVQDYPIVPTTGYNGSLPRALQPTLATPQPW